MRIGLFVPAYRGSVRLEHMRTHTRSREWALSEGHEVGDIDTQMCHIDQARNYATKTALEYDCDRLLMMDADVGVEYPSNALGHLMSVMDETAAAVVGAVVLRRTGTPNVFDQDQSVGTGLILIDLRQIVRIDPPWFQPRYSADGSEAVCTGDIAFCRLVRARGMCVVVDSTLPTIHVGEQLHKFSAPAAVIAGFRDNAPPCVEETAHA